MVETQSARAQKKTAPLDVLQVRGALVARGSSLTRWSNLNGFHNAYVHMAVRGKRRGPVARAIVKRLQQELGL
jgi:hypothetical protein